MPENETQQMILKIIEHAQSAKSSEFHFIRNWSEYRYYKGKSRSFRLVVNALTAGSKRLLKRYCRSIVEADGNLTTLLAYKQMLGVIAFYENEVDVLTNMINEYEAYLLTGGNWLFSILGEQRTEEQCYDHRD